MEARESDYGHNVNPNISSIPSDIDLARDHMNRFEHVDEKQRREFAIYTLFKNNKSEKKIINV